MFLRKISRSTRVAARPFEEILYSLDSTILKTDNDCLPIKTTANILT